MAFFGEKSIMDTIKGVGSWVDEQQLTNQEQVEIKIMLFKAMEPFKVIQRIMVTIIMWHWIIWAANVLGSIWLGHYDGDYALYTKFVEYAQLQMVWVPTAAAVTLYLGGGLTFFKGGKKD